MNSAHRIRVMGRELQVRSAAPAESVRKVEAFVNEKLAEVADDGDERVGAARRQREFARQRADLLLRVHGDHCDDH